MDNRSIRITYRILLILGSTLGVWLLIRETEDVTASFSYFTTQSNVLCVLLFGWLVVRDLMKKDGEPAWLPLLKGQTTVGIVLTGIVFNVMLRPFIGDGGSYDPTSLKDFLVHVSTPVLSLLDYFLFDRKGRFTVFQPLYWTAFPILYWVYTIVYAALGGTFWLSEDAVSAYPYFFMDVSTYGPLPIVVVALFVVLIGYGLFWTDRGLARRAEAKR
ncbi:MAG: Pr6Pr family membrane protein [Candidatus Izemoplasmatales bacterium]